MWVAFNPNKALSVLGVCHGSQLSLLNPQVSNEKIMETTSVVMSECIDRIEGDKSAEWVKPTATEKEIGFYLNLNFSKVVLY
jgi:hypothetical protein